MAARVQRAPAMRMIGWTLRAGLSRSDAESDARPAPDVRDA
jgi:hypothetical protein